MNGAVANITASRISAKPMRKFRVFQTDSYISMDYSNGTGVLYRKGFGEVFRPRWWLSSSTNMCYMRNTCMCSKRWVR